MTVHAIKPIATGEELTVSALPLNYYLSVAETVSSEEVRGSVHPRPTMAP